jgi:hypothetical protein
MSAPTAPKREGQDMKTRSGSGWFSVVVIAGLAVAFAIAWIRGGSPYGF